MSRRYQLKARAETQAETRQRIVDAAIHLHETVGPARTTITAIAERAGVGRLSVYRHFPQDADLLAACSSAYWERNPAPDPQPWRQITDPVERLRVALTESYAYHRRTAAMIARVLADVGDQPHMIPYHQHWQHAAQIVAAGWKPDGRTRHRLQAAAGHALSFTTWQSLSQQHGLSDRAAIAVMTCMVTCAATGPQAAGPAH